MPLPVPVPENPRRGVALAVASSAFASVFLLAFQAASRAAPRDAVVLAMLACATVLNGGLALARRGRAGDKPISRKATWLTVLVFTATTIGGNIGVAGALERLGPGITGTILQTQIFLVALGGRLFLGERMGPAFLAGAALAFSGFVVLGLADPGDGRVDAAGVGFALLASACFGGMLLWTRGVIAKIEPVTVNLIRLLFAVLVMALLPGRLATALTLPWSVWLVIVLAAACGPFLSRLALLFAAEHLSASRTKLITLIGPVLAFGLEWAVLGTPPALHELAAGALILGGVLLPLALEARARHA